MRHIIFEGEFGKLGQKEGSSKTNVEIPEKNIGWTVCQALVVSHYILYNAIDIMIEYNSEQG